MKLCIDPGHGMANRKPGLYDPGAEASGVTEADIVLQWGLTLKWMCEQAGIPVYMTRADDRTADPVSLRDDKAEAAGCTHMISLHCNASDGNARGTETFYRDGADKAFAAVVQKAAMGAVQSLDRGLKTEGESQHSRLAMFDFDGPNCLVEIGFIDNPSDRFKLLSRDVRIAFAKAIVAYLKPTEKE